MVVISRFFSGHMLSKSNDDNAQYRWKLIRAVDCLNGELKPPFAFFFAMSFKLNYISSFINCHSGRPA